MLSENDGDSVDSVMVGCDNLELKIDLDRNFACHSTVAMLNLAVLLLPMILVGGRQRTHRNEGQQVLNVVSIRIEIVETKRVEIVLDARTSIDLNASQNRSPLL